MQTCGEVEIELHAFIILAICEWIISVMPQPLYQQLDIPHYDMTHGTVWPTEPLWTHYSLSSHCSCQLLETPSVDQVPRTPSVDQVPRTPSVDQVPRTPSVDQVPLTPSVDQVPRTPSVDQVPRTSSVDQVPRTPSVDQVPRTPSSCYLPPHAYFVCSCQSFGDSLHTNSRNDHHLAFSLLSLSLCWLS